MRKPGSVFFSEEAFFEAREGGFVFRPSATAPGIEVTAAEKDRLFEGLVRLMKRSAVEGVGILLVAFGVIFYDALATQSVNRAAVVMLFLGLGAVALLTLYRRDKLVERILPRRQAKVPRKPWKTILNQPKSVFAPQVALSSMQLARGLFLVALVLFDGIFIGLLGYAFANVNSPDPEIAAQAQGTLDKILGSPKFGGAVAGLNGILGLMAVMLTREIRKIRARIAAEGG